MPLKLNKDTIIDIPEYLKSEDGLFDSKYMVLFDGEKEEGPYNDAYLFCYVKHGLITKDTLVREVGKRTHERAYDNDDLRSFFDYIERTSDDKHDVTKDSDIGDNIPKKLASLYIDNEDLFEEVDGADEALEHIHELSIDDDRLDKYNGEIFFSIDDLECYLKEDLSESQNAIVKQMVKETYRFLLHTKWDADLPAELIDLTVDVAELFDDPYTHIDYRILRATYNMHKKSLRQCDVDDMLEFLKDRFVDNVIPRPDQEEKIRQIAEIMHNYINS